MKQEPDWEPARAWMARAQGVISNYREAYGIDHRNQSLARRLDRAAAELLLDYEEARDSLKDGEGQCLKSAPSTRPASGR